MYIPKSDKDPKKFLEVIFRYQAAPPQTLGILLYSFQRAKTQTVMPGANFQNPFE